jgi:hypothetical protein
VAFEGFKSSLQCTRLLLQAGADPTSSVWVPAIDAETGEDIDVRKFPPLMTCLEHDTLVSRSFAKSVIADTS